MSYTIQRGPGDSYVRVSWDGRVRPTQNIFSLRAHISAMPRWMMRRTGQYKLLNLVFGILPLIGAILIRQMREDSSPAHLWFSIDLVTQWYYKQCTVRLPPLLHVLYSQFVDHHHDVVALVASLPSDQLAVGTGFAQLVRGL
ncbi:hypothetical protein H0H93_004859, partial [Arthromyces matolae]